MKTTRRMNINLIVSAITTLMFVVAVEARTSGTPGKIAKFKSPTTLGDSVITEDKLGNVGVGTTLPRQDR